MATSVLVRSLALLLAAMMLAASCAGSDSSVAIDAIQADSDATIARAQEETQAAEAAAEESSQALGDAEATIEEQAASIDQLTDEQPTALEETAPLLQPTVTPAAPACMELDATMAESLVGNPDTGVRYIEGPITAARWIATDAQFPDFPDSTFYSVVVRVAGQDVLFGFFSSENTPDTGIAFWEASNAAAELTGFPSSNRATEGLSLEFTELALRC